MTGIMAEAVFLARTGWSWQEYMDAPEEIVRALWELYDAQGALAKEQE